VRGRTEYIAPNRHCQVDLIGLSLKLAPWPRVLNDSEVALTAGPGASLRERPIRSNLPYDGSAAIYSGPSAPLPLRRSQAS